MKKLNLLDLVNRRGVFSKEGLLSRNSVHIYKSLNPNNMMREKRRNEFTLKREAVTAVVFDETAQCLKKKVTGYQASPARTWEEFKGIVKSIPQAPGKLIVVGKKRGVLVNEKALIISSNVDLKEKVSRMNINGSSLYQHLTECLSSKMYDVFVIIQVAEVL